MHNLKELKIWNKSIDLATHVYKILGVSNGSSFELQTQLIISRNLGLVNDGVDALLDEIKQIQKMNYNLQNTLTK